MAQTKQFGVAYAAATLPLDGTETLSIVQGGITVDVTTADLATAVSPASVQGSGLDVDSCGFRGIPVNDQSGNYTCVAADSGKMVRHPSGGGAGDTFTIPANASVAYEIGAAITFCNLDSNALTIAIASDTLRIAGVGTAGSRTLAQYGLVTAVKVDTALWLISGSGMT